MKNLTPNEIRRFRQLFEGRKQLPDGTTMMNQADLADFLGLSVATVKAYEIGKRAIPRWVSVKLAETLARH